MKRWNGWGDDAIHPVIPSTAHNLLFERLGRGRSLKDYPLSNFLQRVPPSRLPHHISISVDSKARLDHSHGHSLPDWIGLRYGTLERFPDGVAVPRCLDEVVDLLRFARKNRIIIIPFGGGTSVVGHLRVPEDDRPVLSLSLANLHRCLAINADSLLATFEAGITGSALESRLLQHGLTLGHYPQSFEFSTLGGWVATRSSGQQSAYYGRIEDLFAGGELATPRGILHLSSFPASAAGPDLRQLVLGSEGRLGVLTKVTVRVRPVPERDVLYGIFFPTWDQGVKAVRAIAGSGIPFSMIRLSTPEETETNLALAGTDKRIDMLRYYLRLRGFRSSEACMGLIGFTGIGRLARSAKHEAFHVVRRHCGISLGTSMGEFWKKNRFRSAYLRNTLWDMGYGVDTVETALSWDRVMSAVAGIEAAIRKSAAAGDEPVHVFSHLSHVYPSGSSVYTTAIFRLSETGEATMARWQALKAAASRAIVDAGGTISHQHGVGEDHKPYLAEEKGSVGMDAISRLCLVFDPEQQMNPFKLVD